MPCIDIKESIELSIFTLSLIQAFLFAMLILTLRSSLLNFYRSNPKYFYEFHPEFKHLQSKNYKFFSILNFKIFIYGNFFEKKFLELCVENYELSQDLLTLKTSYGIEDDKIKPYHLLTIYNMKKCLVFSLWSFIFISIIFFLKILLWYIS